MHENSLHAHLTHIKVQEIVIGLKINYGNDTIQAHTLNFCLLVGVYSIKKIL